MNQITQLKQEELCTLRNQVHAEYEEFRARGLALDMTRGKPSPEQLDLANDLLTLPGSRRYFAAAGEIPGTTGVLQGLPEARRFSPISMGARSTASRRPITRASRSCMTVSSGRS